MTTEIVRFDIEGNALATAERIEEIFNRLTGRTQEVTANVRQTPTTGTAPSPGAVPTAGAFGGFLGTAGAVGVGGLIGRGGAGRAVGGGSGASSSRMIGVAGNSGIFQLPSGQTELRSLGNTGIDPGAQQRAFNRMGELSAGNAIETASQTNRSLIGSLARFTPIALGLTVVGGSLAGVLNIIGSNFFDRLGSINQLASAFTNIGGDVETARRNLDSFTGTLRTSTLRTLSELDGASRVLFINLPQETREVIDDYASLLADVSGFSETEATRVLTELAANGTLSSDSFSTLAGELGRTNTQLSDLLEEGDTPLEGLAEHLDDVAGSASGIPGALVRARRLFGELGDDLRETGVGSAFTTIGNHFGMVIDDVVEDLDRFVRASTGLDFEPEPTGSPFRDLPFTPPFGPGGIFGPDVPQRNANRGRTGSNVFGGSGDVFDPISRTFRPNLNVEVQIGGSSIDPEVARYVEQRTGGFRIQ